MVIVLVAFVGVASIYAVRTPLFEMPGEPWHYRRIETFWGGTLPPGLSSLEEAPPEPQADHQPPLYYAIGSLIAALSNTQSDPAVYRPNPHAVPGDPYATGEKNVMIAVVAAQPNGPLATAIGRLRFFSVVTSAGTLFFTYLVFMRLTSGRTSTALAGLVALAFLPGFLYLSGGVENRSLGLLLSMVALYLCMRLLTEPLSGSRTAWAASIAAGLASLTIWWGWAPVVLVIAAHLMHSRGQAGNGQSAALPPLWSHLALMGAMALPWRVWLMTQPPQAMAPLGWSRLVETGLLGRTQIALRAYWGLFGWLNIAVDDVYYTTVGLLLVLSLSGLILRAVQAIWEHRDTWMSRVAGLDTFQPIHKLASLQLGLSVAVFGFHLVSPATTFLGAALLPAAPLLSLLFVLGLDLWVRRTYASILIIILLLTFAAVSFVAPFAYIEPAYAQPARLDLDEMPADVRPLDLAFGEDLFLLGYTLEDESVRPGEILTLRLYWLARRRMTKDYWANFSVRGYDDAMVASRFTHPGGGTLPTSLWVPGDVILHEVDLLIDGDAKVPTAGTVRLALYSDEDCEPIPGRDPHGNRLMGDIAITRVRLAPTRAVRHLPEERMDVNLDYEVSLLGYGLHPPEPAAGSTVRVVLYWRAEGPLIQDYTVFIHLTGDDGRLVSQIDGPPLLGNYPSYFWTMGEEVRDAHLLELPEDLPTGSYYLEIGMYRSDIDERLSIVDSDPPRNAIRIGPITVR